MDKCWPTAAVDATEAGVIDAGATTIPTAHYEDRRLAAAARCRRITEAIRASNFASDPLEPETPRLDSASEPLERYSLHLCSINVDKVVNDVISAAEANGIALIPPPTIPLP